MGKMMKHQKFIMLMIFGAISVFVLSSEVQADVPGRGRGSCPDINTLEFVGQHFEGSASLPVYCIPANTDGDAMRLCGNDDRGGGYTAVNPGNPQYITPNLGNGNNRTENTLGYYYCVPKRLNSKAAMCRDAQREGYEFEWQSAQSGSGRDGDCMCRRTNVPNSAWSLECADEDTAPAETAATPTPPDTPDEPAQAAATTSGDNTRSNAFVSCVQSAAASALRCKNNAEVARRICDSQNNQSTSGQVGDALGAVGSVYAQANANSGTQANCFKAGLIANGARMALNPTSESCQESIEGCSVCGEDKYDEFRQQCLTILQQTQNKTIEQLMVEAPNSPEVTAWNENESTIRNNYSEGLSICQAGRDNQNKLNQLLTGLGNALQQSLVCACQTSSSALGTTAVPGTPQQAQNSNCATAIPNPDDCATNPSLPNCNLYGSMNVCTPGAGYDAAACNCQMNPRSAGCPGATTGDGVSNFAGAGLNAKPGDTVSFGALAGGGGRGGSSVDLSTPDDPAALNFGGAGDNKGGRERLPMVSGAGGGSAAGGGGGTGAAPEEGVAAAPSSGLGGLMNQLKTGYARLMGGKATTNGNIRVNKKPGAGGDLSKFRPRGLASSSGVGSKNMDIWRMMNMCVQGDTCKRNVNNYITAP